VKRIFLSVCCVYLLITIAAGTPAAAAAPSSQALINKPSGFEVMVPAGFKVDNRYAPAFTRIYSDGLDVKISREISPYDDIAMYLRDYPNRFIAREDFAAYRELNGIHLVENGTQTVAGVPARVIRFNRTPSTDSAEWHNEYLLVYVPTRNQEFYCLFFRANSYSAQLRAINQILYSFSPIPVEGTAQFDLDLKPVPGKWNDETRTFYDKLSAGKEFLWGIFYPWALTKPGQYEYISSMEQKLGYDFKIILHYLNAGDAFPTAGMLAAYDKKQIVELTLQIVTRNNEDANEKNPNFDLLDGQLDDTVRAFARDARAFGHPFLFRLNNEMNTDWSQYSGVRTLSDPDVFIKNWRRIYRIFEEEGVINAIWVFNPNQRSYPPMNWNHHLSYFPGNEYVHVIGLTGYNTGEYYRSLTGEKWRSFAELYDPVVADYRTFYGKFPWMITEFASSSNGGDKEKWIKDMFPVLATYPEIKAAVWWSYCDYDLRPEFKEAAARPYWLDEKASYLDAFRSGLRKQGLLK
jgi:mannan endo-1,4-beta-mannosidase